MYVVIPKLGIRVMLGEHHSCSVCVKLMFQLFVVRFEFRAEY
jgi:hypothetical protein